MKNESFTGLRSRDVGAGLSPPGDTLPTRIGRRQNGKRPRIVIARPQRGRGNLGKAVMFSPGVPCYPPRSCEIAPQGHFLALRAQGATSGLRPPRNDTGRRHSQVCHCEAPQEPWQSRSTGRNTGKPPANSQVRSRDRRPRRFIFPAAKNQGQAIGLPLCFVLLQLRVAHEDGRELCAGGVAGRLEAAVLAVDDARTDAPAQRVNSP